MQKFDKDTADADLSITVKPPAASWVYFTMNGH